MQVLVGRAISSKSELNLNVIWMVRNYMRIVYMSEADALNEIPAVDRAMISITEPGRSCPIGAGWGALLHVRFCDAEYDQEMIDRFAYRNKRFIPEEKGFPAASTVTPIIQFIKGLDAGISELIVHCHAGQRRSAAVALYASEEIACSQFSRAKAARETMNVTVYNLLKDPSSLKIPKVGIIRRLLDLIGK